MNLYRVSRIGWAAVMLVLAGCAKGEGGAAAARAETKVATGADVKPVTEFFPFTVGGKTLRIQVVVLNSEQQRGLMGRKDLGADDGMVFVYPAPQQMSFWMKNTPTPLDIGFFKADGTLGEVHPLYPYDETAVRSKGEDYTLALETNQGWFAKNGLKPGAKADLRQLADALRARGFKPERYSVRVE
ncbi:MAG: DUF192 domain-containing protein [Burkholderiales bacterium]|nr:DUF192 domain-containing protein [Opitutaceae bacterium]